MGLVDSIGEVRGVYHASNDNDEDNGGCDQPDVTFFHSFSFIAVLDSELVAHTRTVLTSTSIAVVH